MRPSLPFPLALLALSAAACVQGGVRLDDSGNVEGDADTDADTDTDTDTDADLPGEWEGEVGMVLQATGDPFCEGTVELTLEAGTTLAGSGACEIVAGPGQGQLLELGFDGTVAGDAVSGQVELLMADMPQPPPPVDMAGSVDADSLQLSFEVEMSPPDDPDAVEVADGAVLARPVD